MADPSSSNHYIRTYAQDLAEASGQPMPASASATTTLPSSTVSEQTSAAEERDAVLERLMERAKKDPITEGELLPQSIPTPLPSAPSTDERPEDLIVTPQSSSETLPAQTFTPQVPIPTVYTESIPHATTLANLAPPPPLLKEESEPLVPRIKKEEGPSPLHTYTSDFSDRIDSQSASTFSVLAAQSDASGTIANVIPQKKSNKSALIVAFSVLLLLVGGAGAYGAYRYVATRSFVPVLATVPSLVFADEREAVAGEGTILMQAVANSALKELGQGKVRVLYLTEASTAQNNQPIVTALPGGRLIGALQLPAPDILLRNIGEQSTTGIVHAGEESRVFFILRVLSYERTFAGMLTWESKLADQLELFYPPYPAPPPPPTVVTTKKLIKGKLVVSTSTVETVAPQIEAPRFIDEITSNHNVRALKDGSGKTILLYGYRDKETLIIARDENAFAELSNRLSATKQQ